MELPNCDSSVAAPANPQSYALSFAKSEADKRWTRKDLSLDDLRCLFEPDAREIRDTKEGECFAPALLVGDKRNAVSVDSVSILVFDIDGSQSLAEAEKLLGDADVIAFLSTTHSHRSTRTYVAVKDYEAWALKQKKPKTPTAALLCEFLETKDKPRPGARFQPTWYKRIADVGNCYYVEHEPVDKFRVLLPLLAPIVMADLDLNDRTAMGIYKSIYRGVGHALGLKFDHSCTDPSRLFYLPSCPASMKEHARTLEFDGAFLDWTKYKRHVEPTRQGVKGKKLSHEGMNLKAWAPNIPDKDVPFDIEGFVDQYLPDSNMGERKGGGYVITCPYCDEHSTPQIGGTFCANDDGKNPWTIHCMHASCKSADRKRMDYIAGWLDQGLITVEQLEEFSGHKFKRARKGPLILSAAKSLGLSQ